MEENSKPQRRCIGVFTVKPDREYQSGLLRGIYKAAFENDMNVAVFAASLFGGIEADKESEFDVFALPNYDKLAGIIYIPAGFEDSRAHENLLKPLIKAAAEKRLHAVTIDCEIEGLPSLTCDDSNTTRAILEHLMKCHGCRDIAFMTGTKGNAYAESRLDIYKKIMSDNGFEVLPERTYYGDFWYNEGENFVNQLRNSPDGLPEAIVCANGPMARSVYKALLKFGYVVPNDVIVACHTDEENTFKFITSSSKRADAEGYAACKKLISLINGNDEPERTNLMTCECSINGSLTCGCMPAEKYDHSKMDGIDINDPNSYFSEYNFMMTDLLNRPSYREMFWGLDWYTSYIPDIRGIYFCLCHNWAKPCDEAELEQTDSAGENLFSEPKQRGYTDMIQPYYYRVNNDDGTHESTYESNDLFPVEEMFPKLFDASGEPSSYIFRSLHFVDKNFGYVVIDNGSRMKTYDISYDFWLKNVSNAMEYQRKLGNEKYLYTSDFMTGLINRNGFNRMMPNIIAEAHRGDFQLLFAVCDLNGLKFINDTFGHVEGDNSIKTAADALCESCFPHLSMEKNFRIGGDEFVKAVIGHFTDSEVEAFKNKVYASLEEYNKTSGKPYPVILSIGAVVKDPDDDYTPDTLIRDADKLMFADKQRLKKLTGFDPKRSM